MMRLYEWFKAWRRKEVRIAPKGVRGRVYAKKEDVKSSGGLNVTVEPKVSCQVVVTRADGTVESFEAPAQIVRS